jgi:RND family efflux transporter MFP subunit
LAQVKMAQTPIDMALPYPRGLRARLAFIALLAGACADPDAAAGGPEAGAPPAREVLGVRTAIAQEETWEQTLHVTGQLAAYEVATLSAKVPGRVEALEVDLGERVQRGQATAAIDTRDYELRKEQAAAGVEAARARLGSALAEDGSVHPEEAAIVREARSALEDAEREAQRISTLLESGVAAQSTYDTLIAQRDQADSRLQAAMEEVHNRGATLTERLAGLALAEQQLADARLLAPFDGAVAERLAGTGDYLQVGDPVLRLVRFDPLRLRLEVPERSSAALKPGQVVRAELEGGIRAPEGRITRISPEISARSRTLLIEVELANPDGHLRPGSFARATIVLDDQARALVVPAAALVRFAGIDKVFVVDGGKAVERRIEVGREAGERVEVTSGLSAGEVVVLAPGGLQDGAPVRVEP